MAITLEARPKGAWSFGVFHTHQGLPYLQSTNSKAIGQLETFPRQFYWSNVFISSISFYLDVQATASLQLDANLEEFRIILASKQARIFDIQVQGLEIKKISFKIFFEFSSGIKANVSQAPEETSVNLTLSDLRVFDPHTGARYQKVQKLIT